MRTPQMPTTQVHECSYCVMTVELEFSRNGLLFIYFTFYRFLDFSQITNLSSMGCFNTYNRKILSVRVQLRPSESLQRIYNWNASSFLSLGPSQDLIIYLHQVTSHLHHHLWQLAHRKTQTYKDRNRHKHTTHNKHLISVMFYKPHAVLWHSPWISASSELHREHLQCQWNQRPPVCMYTPDVPESMRWRCWWASEGNNMLHLNNLNVLIFFFKLYTHTHTRTICPMVFQQNVWKLNNEDKSLSNF